MRYLVLYERTNGELLYRLRNSIPQYEIGSYTSMGWKVLDIRHLYKGKCLSLYDYSTAIQNRVVRFASGIDYRKIVEYVALLTLFKIFL